MLSIIAFKNCVQCQFSDNKERSVDTIIYGTKVQKAREKLLQMPKHLTLRDCFKICHHYESFQYHLNVVKSTDKPAESITKHHCNRGGKQSSVRAKKTVTFRSQPSAKPVNSTNNTVKCSNCGTTHPKYQGPAYHVTCFKCNKVGHCATKCRANSSNLLKIQDNLTDFVVEVGHLMVEDLLQEGRSTKQLRSLKPSLMRNLT